MSQVHPLDGSADIRPVSQLTARPVAWLWRPRLGFGKLAMLDGDPGVGKSLVTLDLAARLSTGRPLPDGSPGPGPASAIVLNGEDGAADTIRPRLQALGADLDRVFVLDAAGDDVQDLLRLPRHVYRLDEALARTGARLVVIDPVVAFLDARVNLASDLSVRRALAPLELLARKYACAIVLVRHLNKKEGGRSLYRGGGSIGFLGACRSGWLLAGDPHDPRARRVLAEVKNNLGPPQPSLAVSLQLHETGPPSLTWLGESPWTADDLLARRIGPSGDGANQRDRARAFLNGLLQPGPRTSREVWDAAQEHDLSERTIRRAKVDLKVRSVRVWLDGKCQSYWLLEGQELPPSVPPEAVPPSLEPWLAPLREKYPAPTPLDEA